METPAAVRHRKSQLASASFVLGLLGLGLGFITGLPAILTGHVAREHIRRNRILTGRRKAVAGMALGYVTTLGSFALLIVVSEMVSKSERPVVGSQAGAVKARLSDITAKLERYRTMGGVYPSTTQGLEALVAEPVDHPLPMRWRQQFVMLPRDPWGNPFVYELKGQDEIGAYEVFSKGPDGLARTPDDIGTTVYQ